MKSRFPKPGMFDQALAAQGMTLEGLRTEMRRNLSIQKLIEADIVSQASVTPEAMRSFYDENQEQMR